VLPTEGEQRVAVFGPLDPRRGWGFSLQLQAVPGDPTARPEDVDYQLPIEGDRWRIGQGWNGRFSHTAPDARHAIDIAADEGTPVLAAREGVVMQIADDFRGAGLDLEKFGARANFVRILHADGSMALYAHLQPETAQVRPGARVRAGQVIGAVGNTGFSTGPHLHFVVQVNRGLRLESVPFRLQGPTGAVAIPGG
jgi:murein DD-endopeptidase MepM/ murein hydrolase activator NlpD